MAVKGRIVTTHYRYKPPPGKRKTVALAGPAIVRKRGRADAVPVPPLDEPKPAPPPPANDDRKTPPPLGAHKPAIATSISRKLARFQRAEQAAEPDDDPEATARVRAFLDRMIRPRDP